MATQFVKQHIVPKKYLDRFAFDGCNVPVIGTRLNRKGKPSFFTASTSDVGYIKNYYDVTDKDDPKYWEHFLAEKIDTLCGTPLGNLISTVMLSKNDAAILGSNEKSFLAKLIMAQIMRVPDSLEYVRDQLYPRVSKQVKEGVASSLPQFMLEKYGERLKNMELSEQYQKELLLNHAFAPENFNRYCGMLQDGIWMVYVNAMSKGMPFVTSDNPVLVEGIGGNKNGLFHNGLANPTTCIFFPISPSIAVARYARNGLIGIAADEFDGRKIILDDLKYIIDKNIKIIEQSFHHSFVPQTLYNELTN